MKRIQKIKVNFKNFLFKKLIMEKLIRVNNHVGGYNPTYSSFLMLP